MSNYIAPYSNQIIELHVKEYSLGTCLLGMLTTSVQVLLPWMGHCWLYVRRCTVYDLNSFEPSFRTWVQNCSIHSSSPVSEYSVEVEEGTM